MKSQEIFDFVVTLDVGNCNVDNALSLQMKTSAPSVTAIFAYWGHFRFRYQSHRDGEELLFV